jgi:hypothetical protein
VAVCAEIDLSECDLAGFADRNQIGPTVEYEPAAEIPLIEENESLHLSDMSARLIMRIGDNRSPG